MTTVHDVSQWLDRFAPTRLAESWDNVGLLWGDPGAEVTRVMTCLTVTNRTAMEAVHERAELIVSHHPVLFRAVKRVRADLPETGMLWTLARAGVAIASPHTAFDNTEGGINDGLAGRLGLIDVGPLRPTSAAGNVQGGRLYAEKRPRGRPGRGVRGGGRTDRGLRRMLVHHPRPRHLLRYGGSEPDRGPGRPPRVGPRAADRGRLSDRAPDARPGRDPRGALLRGAGHRRLPAPSGEGRSGRGPGRATAGRIDAPGIRARVAGVLTRPGLPVRRRARPAGRAGRAGLRRRGRFSCRRGPRPRRCLADRRGPLPSRARSRDARRRTDRRWPSRHRASGSRGPGRPTRRRVSRSPGLAQPPRARPLRRLCESERRKENPALTNQPGLKKTGGVSDRRGKSIEGSTRRLVRGGLGRVAGTRFATGRRHGQVGLVFPLTLPGLTGPALKGDRANGGPILVADHLAPGTGVSGSNLRRTFTHAKQALAAGGQACHGPPVLSACGFTHAHRSKNPRPTARPTAAYRIHAEGTSNGTSGLCD